MNSETTKEELPCAEKLAFDSLKQAQTAATVSEYQHGTHLKAYHCKFCGLYHLSTDHRE